MIVEKTKKHDQMFFMALREKNENLVKVIFKESGKSNFIYLEGKQFPIVFFLSKKTHTVKPRHCYIYEILFGILI